MACKLPCWFWYLLDSILITLECLIQVYSCGIVYQIVLFNIDIISHHSQRVCLQVHRNPLGDECHSPNSSNILPNYSNDNIAFWRWLHILQNICEFSSTTSEPWRSTSEVHCVAFSLFSSFWKLLADSVWWFTTGELLSDDFRTVLHFANVCQWLQLL
jgi:hypothetical protein